MSLVAYDSSDDSNTGDSEEQSENTVKSTPIQSYSSASDECVISGNRVNTSLFGAIPPPKPVKRSYFEQVEEDAVDPVPVRNYGEKAQDPKRRTTLFSTLPAPKSQDAPSLNDDEQPVFRKKEAKAVKITVPALSSFDSDDDEEPTEKKMKVNSDKTGLFAVLPPPKNATTKVANRALIPHTLTKKPAPAVAKSVPKTLPVPQKFAASSGVSHHDSDDDDDDDNDASDGTVKFFSFETHKSDLLPSIAAPAPVEIPPLTDYSADDVQPQYSAQNVLVTCPESSSETSNSEPGFVTVGSDEASGNSSGPMYGVAYPEEPPTGEDVAHSSTVDLPEEALREFGRRRRGQEEITFIDVSADEQMPKADEWLTKGLTEEKESHSHRKRSHMPTSQQRRKHQITYLAFQAKERELELKNQWAQNRLTKRQTQSKYGF